MKAIYRQHAHAEFREQLPRQLPQFEPLTLRLPKEERKKATLFPGEQVFRWTVGERLLCFINVVPHPSQERFMIDAGWSELGRFPYEITRPTVFATASRKEFSLAECMISFADLYHLKYGRAHLGWDVWDCPVDIADPDYIRLFVEEHLQPISEEDALRRSKEAVARAIEEIKDVVMPYLEQRVAWQNRRTEASGGRTT